MSPVEEVEHRLQALARRSGGSLSTAPEATQQWLRLNSRLPSDFVHILAHSWPSEDLSLGVYDLWSLDHFSESERAKIAFNGGFFLIGCARNGDLLVIRRRLDTMEECEIGLISHEELWEKESDLESIYQPICRGFMTLLSEAEQENRLPLDFYAARERNNT